MAFKKIGFVGAGQMASALASGITLSDTGISGSNINAFDINEQAIKRFTSAVPECNFVSSNEELVEQSDLIILAVKPQIIPQIVSNLKTKDSSKIFVSIMGGINLQWLTDRLDTNRVVRTMPNTPCLIRKGAIGISAGSGVSEPETNAIKELFDSVGVTFILPERLIDSVTGLSGSGPAFVYQFIEALSDGGVRMGLPRDVAMTLAAQTVVGAGEMVLQTGEHPGQLKDKVASPGGTTIAGLKALEDRGFRSAAINAVESATNRSIELGADS